MLAFSLPDPLPNVFVVPSADAREIRRRFLEECRPRPHLVIVPAPEPTERVIRREARPRPLAQSSWVSSWTPPATKPRARPLPNDCDDYRVVDGEPHAAVCRKGCEHVIHRREQSKVRTRTGAWRDHVLQASTAQAMRDLQRSQLSGDMFGTGEERTNARRPAPYERASRAIVEREAPARILRPLSKRDEAIALAWMAKRPVRPGVDRLEVMGRAWIELVNPTAGIDQPEDLDTRLRRAWDRSAKREEK